MKAVVLAAGKGTRMMPLTKNEPKPLIKVGGEPFLHHVLEGLREAGFTEFGVVVGYEKEKLKKYLGGVVDAEPIEQDEAKGTGDAVRAAQDFVSGEDFVVVMGDNLYDPKDLKKLVKDDEYSYILGKEAERPERYGVLVEKKGLLQEIDEKPEKPKSNLVNVGAYKFTPKVFDALSGVELSPRGEYELTSAVNELASQELVRVVKMTGYWVDFGKPSDVQEVEKFLKRESK